MVPAGFEEANCVLDKPQNAPNDLDCIPLQVCQTMLDGTQPCIISCWKLTTDELAELQRTGRVWLVVWGYGMPPVSLSIIKPNMEQK